MDSARVNGNGNGVRDIDRDALHILPLAMIPIETPGLKRTRMIKNSRLESVVELFEGKGTGSGQVKVTALDLEFDDIAEGDLAILGKLAQLPTYDVYSLRILLREHDIPIADHGYLQLSRGKQRELEGLMRAFTLPLIAHIYGDSHEIRSYADLTAMFRHPDVAKARANLQAFADKIGIRVHEVPKFLEDYGDFFLSISYYSDCLAQIDPDLDRFQRSVKDISTNRQLKDDRARLAACLRIAATFDKLRNQMATRFATFHRGSKAMWSNVDGAGFQKFRTVVQSSQVAIGGILCALHVKMSAWTSKFPTPAGGGVINRADFLITEMQQGMRDVVRLGAAGPGSPAAHGGGLRLDRPPPRLDDGLPAGSST